MNPIVASQTRLGLVLALTAFSLAAQNEPIGATAPAVQDVLRLSGVIVVGAEARMAVVEVAGQGGRLVHVGDSLADGTRVREIGPDWLLVSKDGQDRRLDMSGPAPTPASGPQAADVPPTVNADPPRPERPYPWEGKASAEVIDAVSRVAADPLAGEADLTFVLASLLDLPADARVRPFFPGEEEREQKGVAEVGKAIARGEMVRLMVESGGEEAAIYIMPDHGQSGHQVADRPDQP